MSDYNLQPNETILMKTEGIMHGGIAALYTDELVLTNLNLILCSKGLFGNKKGVTYYPLNRIKVYNDSAQVIETTKGNQPVMEVMFIDGQEAFGFQRPREIKNWIANIKNVVAGNEVELEVSNDRTLPGTELLVDTIKDTFGTVANAFGISFGKTKNEEKAKPAERATVKCVSCGATISGVVGTVVRCEYCGTEQSIKGQG